YSILETVGGSIRGMGYSLTSMLIIMSSLCGLRIALLLIISRFNLGFQGVAYVYPITWFVAAASFSIAFYVYISERMKNKVV
ncbi:MAG: MATE family efflux transporter, partial [Fusobacterium sp.]|nr:MATE family efflux transporter [Fusobacterium sp.]